MIYFGDGEFLLNEILCVFEPVGQKNDTFNGSNGICFHFFVFFSLSIQFDRFYDVLIPLNIQKLEDFHFGS